MKTYECSYATISWYEVVESDVAIDVENESLTLNTLNCFKDYKICLYISHHILDFDQQKTRFTTA